jgi:hypothetical protein
MMLGVEPVMFDGVGELLLGMVPEELGQVRLRAHRYGIKVWFGPAKPTRDHYEAQVIGPNALPSAGAKVLALEVGFHAEHTKEEDNEAILAALVKDERRWRKVVGNEPECGAFIGRAEHWRRVSEVWPDPNLGDPELPFEIAARLTDFITGIEPIRRRHK